MRRLDTLGMTGVVMLVAGATTFLSYDHVLPLWVAWIVGPLLWYLGFAVMIAWLCGRFFLTQAEEEDAIEVAPVRKPQPSNFLEHDWEPTAPARWQTVPILATVMLLLLVSMLAIRAYAADNPGAPLFKAKCAMCHGADGVGKTPMGATLKLRDLTSPEVQKQSDTELLTVITKGRNKMQEYGSKLSKDQIADLQKYIRTLARK